MLFINLCCNLQFHLYPTATGKYLEHDGTNFFQTLYRISERLMRIAPDITGITDKFTPNLFHHSSNSGP